MKSIHVHDLDIISCALKDLIEVQDLSYNGDSLHDAMIAHQFNRLERITEILDDIVASKANRIDIVR